MASRKLIVEIVGDSRSLERAFGRSELAARGFSGRMKGVGTTVDKSVLGLSRLSKLFAGGFAIGAGARVFRGLSDDASDLNEEINKSNVVFGKNATEIQRWATTTAKSFGVSQRAALAASGGFGQILETAGITERSAAQMSKALVQLGSDMASFNNITVDEALLKLRSGLAGEAEPLRTVGVLLSEATVKAEAYATGIAKQGAVLTEAQKVQARYSLILKQTGKQQGDFARTSDGLANQQRILTAEFADLRAELGTRLLPVMLRVTQAAVGIVKSFHGVEVSVESLGSQDFRQKFANVFGIDELRRVLAQFAPQLKALQTQFIKDVQSINVGTLFQPSTTSAAAAPKVPAFGQPGFKPLPSSGFVPTTKLQEKRLALAQAERRNDLALERKIQTEIVAMYQARVDQTKLTGAALLKFRTELLDEQKILDSIDVQIATGVASAAAARTAKIQDAAAKVEAEKAKQVAALEKIRQHQKEVAEKAAELFQARQFRALGLSAEGGDITPSINNLRKQLASLTARLATTGTSLSSKLKGQLAGIRKVLAGEFGKATVETRDKIKQLFDTIRQTFDQESRQGGPLTKTTSLNTNRILDGLGLSRDAEKELRARLSRFNSAGIASAGTSRTASTFPGAGAPIVVNTTVMLDGQRVGQSTKRFLANDRRHNPPQKRGPNSA
jgi:hypothetical protein